MGDMGGDAMGMPPAEPAAAEATPAPDVMAAFDSGAFTTTQSLGDSGPLAEWRAENRKKIEEKAAKSKAALAEIQAKAKSDRDAFYAQRQATIDATKKTNREAEKALKENQASAVAKDNKWESVTDQVDLQGKQDADVARMRQVMLSLKQDS